MLAQWEAISPYVLPFYYLAIFFVVISILLDNRNPLKTHSYLLLLLLLPILGIYIYLFFGQNIRKRKIFAKKQLINSAFGDQVSFKSDDASLLGNNRPNTTLPDGQYGKLIQFLRNDLSPLSTNNKVTVLKNGEAKFPEVFKAIEEAEHHIHLEYYILSDDVIGKKLVSSLIKKAQEGIEVRMIVDGVGSLQLSKAFFREVKQAGIQIVEFMPVLFPGFTSKINYRNHRKILVVDGKIGFTGGVNINDRYINNEQNTLYWRDTHLKIEGESVKSLQFLFFLNWQFITQKEEANVDEYFQPLDKVGEHCVQINASGPDWELASIMDSFFIAINSAKHKVRIATPYFIPNESILDAIMTAARSSVEIDLMIPYESDSWIVQSASLSFLRALMERGVNVYLYQKGFLHSKVIIIDDTFSSVGTANMDYRSFDLNHEVNTYLYDKDLVKTLIDQFEVDKQDSLHLDLKIWKNRGLPEKLKESVCRLLAPLL